MRITTKLVGRVAAALAVMALAAVLVQASAQPAEATHDCGLPHEQPLWIEFGTGAVPPEVRTVFQRPGVVVAAVGTELPQRYREKGAATVFFVINLPRLVGSTTQPAEPATVLAAADEIFQQAVESTGCTTPWIALNELQGSALPTPWSATNAQYRANVVALTERLAQLGARPSVWVNGNPSTAGDAGAWWARLSRSSEIAYEAYYDARNISRLGPLMGNRRIRMGMRSIAQRYRVAGVPRARLGFVLGFQVGLGFSGREGLQPREEWFRVVKWNALAARQVWRDEGSGTIWSWGWGNFGPQSIDPDKPAAACVYLWTRDPKLCGGPAVAGPAFNTSRTEGQIVLPAGIQCSYRGGAVTSAGVKELARLTRSPQVALTALFARGALRPSVRVSQQEVLRAEQGVIQRVFRGSRPAYVRALSRRRASVTVARGILADDLRRKKIAATLQSQASEQTVLTWSSDVEAKAVDTATCLRDELPGTGDFPRSNAREVGVVPLPSYLPFLLGDRTAPAAPAAPTAVRDGAAVVLDWADGVEADLVGYHVYRATTPGGPYKQLTQTRLVRSTFADATPPAGATPYYVVRAQDTSRNLSSPSAEVTPPPTG